MTDSQNTETDSTPRFGGDSEEAYRQGKADAWTALPSGALSRLGLDDSTILVDEDGDALAIFDDFDCLASYFLGRGAVHGDLLAEEAETESENHAISLARHLIGIRALFASTVEAEGAGGAAVVNAVIPTADFETAKAAVAEFERRRREATGEEKTLDLATEAEAQSFGRANFGRALRARTDPKTGRTEIYAAGDSEKVLASTISETLTSIALQAAHPKGAG